jgi:glycosyltransferase involved in cell wall biosynthesis
LYTNRFDRAATFPELADLPVVELAPISVRRSISAVARAAATLLTQRLDLRGHDSLLVVSEGLGNFVAARSPIPTSCLCLTPLKVVYDHVTRDRFFGGASRLEYRLAFAAYRALERRAWLRYRQVFCISEEVRRRTAGLVPAERLEVVYPGVDLARYRPTGERENFFLVPGRIMWQKNIELVIAAWARCKPAQDSNPFRLVIAGMVDVKSRPYVARLRALAGDRSDIQFIGSPSDDELLGLYQRCRAVVFAAPNEDWGFVPVEAMACGKAVLATDRGGPRESIIDGVTGFLRPDDTETFASALSHLMRLPNAALDEIATAARARASEFPWGRFVSRIDDHIDELAGSRSSQLLAVGG